MEKIINPVKINRSNFNTYGDLISTNDINPMDINAGYAKRFDNLANLDTSKDGGKTIVSIFSALKRTFPMKIDMMEKHPLGSQAFIPMKETTFLCFVAPPGDFPEINKIIPKTNCSLIFLPLSKTDKNKIQRRFSARLLSCNVGLSDML